MTGVPCSITEHRLNIRERCPLVRQKKRGQAPERTKAIQTEVEKLVEEGIMREVYYHDWLSNLLMRQMKKKQLSTQDMGSTAILKYLLASKTLVPRTSNRWTRHSKNKWGET
uniref:Reverse transcriptase domain-containing protein n=1 Tax=Tanacetum cinerariifolium TaxID=118510 RepID=A0A699QT11_TANCI|nr:reverse transcriptase domain-containing protein [Tanacetum cinerariifolium]